LGHPQGMNNPRILKAVIAVLAAALVISVGFSAFEFRLRSIWEATAADLVVDAAAMRATSDYEAGKRELRVIEGESDSDLLTGRHDGPFEIRVMRYRPSFLEPRHITEKALEGYNARMRAMHARSVLRSSLTNTATSADKP
jgi:hypothetical protein